MGSSKETGASGVYSSQVYMLPHLPRDGHPTFVFAHFSASQKHQNNPMLRIMQFWQFLLPLQNNHPKIITKVIVEKSILHND